MDKYDLIVVGTGFATTFFLKEYLERSSSAVKVLVIERGKLHTHKERLQLRSVSPQNYTANITQSHSTYTTRSDKPWVFDPNFGGSSNCWTGCTPRFMPNDFQLKSKYGVGEDWPLSYNDLENYYCKVENFMQVSGPKSTPYPMSQGYPLPPHKLSSFDILMQERYGDLFISQPTGRASTNVENRNACCSSSVCNLCPVDAKFTIENACRPLFEDARVTVLYEAQVYSLDLKADYAESVKYVKDGKEHVARGETIVLGANPIFNAHILLNAGDDNLLTGAGICEQVGTFARVYLDGVNNVGGSSVITANGYMLYDGDHRRDRAACYIESWNTPFIRNEPGRWREMALLKLVLEDIPSNNNRVKLTDDPLMPKIDYSGHSDYVNRSLASLESDLNTVLDFLPIEKIELDGYAQKTEYHICSTTRMSEHPTKGVLNKKLVHHKYNNLLVLGSGSFPAISPSNPTLTISALSMYAADNYLM